MAAQQISMYLSPLSAARIKQASVYSRKTDIPAAHYREVGEKFGQRLDIVAYQKIIS